MNKKIDDVTRPSTTKFNRVLDELKKLNGKFIIAGF